jgi:polyisoprenoid-binding protein YceI/rhodanese-related sulfurtransferase
MNSALRIDRDELLARLKGGNAPLVIDVLPEEEFERMHLPGAKNACVYNVTFLEDVGKLMPDRGRAIVLYGSSNRNLASATAAEKLVGVGYTDVADYRGGLADWRAAGQPVEGDSSKAPPEARPREGKHRIDLDKSRIEWTGRNLTGAHMGTLKLSAGEIEIENGQPVRGEFTLEMSSIANTDLEDGEMRKMLMAHLKSDDFFDVARFPTAELHISKITSVPEAKPGSPNAEVTGELTLKGVRRAITFSAMLGVTPDGLLAADAHFDIDRTQWNVLYGSGKFYEMLGKHLVNDEISLALKLVTREAQEDGVKSAS